MSAVRRLRVIVTALLKSLRRNVLDIIALLLMTMFIFAIMGYYLFGGAGTSQTSVYWGTFAQSFQSMFILVTAEGWTEIQKELNEFGYGGAEWFLIFSILMGNFIFTNLFIGVITQVRRDPGARGREDR